jgi:hypothetical protein
MTTITPDNLMQRLAAKPLPVVGAVPLRPGVLQAQTPHFSELLKVNDTKTDRIPETTSDTVRHSAQEFVALSLVQPVLAAARNDPFRASMFHGGQAEDAFGQQLDAQLAQRITQRANLPVVDAVYRRIMSLAQRRNGAQVKGPERRALSQQDAG